MHSFLLLSNSTLPGQPYLQFGKPVIQQFLGNISEVLFIPFAAVTFTYEVYTEKVSDALNGTGIKVTGIHTLKDKVNAIKTAKAIMIGGGNTFKLLAELQQNNLIEHIKHAVKGGVPYIGWSAGANVACPTIMTTNDMPVVQPESFKAIDLIQVQINPHFTNNTIPGHNGETRLQRLQEFATLHPNQLVIGLPEGTYLRFENGSLNYYGNNEYLLLKGDEMRYSAEKTII